MFSATDVGKEKMILEGLRAVIWDFNGTLVDDTVLAVRSINTQLSRRGLPVLTVDSYRAVFGFPMTEYYRRLGFDLEVETLKGLADEFHEAYLPGLPECPLHEGVVELLELIRKAGISQFVLSAMEEGALRAAIERLGIDRHFTGVYGLGNRLADSKVLRGKELLQHFHLRGAETLLVGDTDHDAEVATALGISAVLVAQGHQSVERLRALGCPVVDTFRELPEALALPEGGQRRVCEDRGLFAATPPSSSPAPPSARRAR
jgi:phosphoglycolate phosphatase